MARKRTRPLLLSAGLPWWVWVLLAAGSWIAVVFFLPDAVARLPVFGRQLGALVDRLGWAPATVVAAVLLSGAAASWRERWRKARLLLDARDGIASIRALSWREFEELVAEAFRREGYSVVENRKAGTDGGVDIRLRRNGELFLVQCKNWNRNRVGVGVVREMCGVMMDEGAAGVVIVCSGRFTRDAWSFAGGKPVRLLDGRALAAMIEGVRRHGGRRGSRGPVAAFCAAIAALALLTEEGAAQRAGTPEAKSFEIWVDEAEHLIVGVVETVPGTDEGVGFAIRCVRDSGVLEGSLAFGIFPPGKRVQAAVRAPCGRIERFGPAAVGARDAGFHVPEVAGRSEVLRLMNAAMAEGALISNGHNSVRNRISDAENARAKRLLNACSKGRR